MTAMLEERLDKTLGIDELPTAPPPVHFGPTWDVNPDWSEGMPKSLRYRLPEITLGWQIIAWVEGIPSMGVAHNLQSDETDAFGNHLPFKLTQEQVRFLLWLYAIDERGRFIYREAVLQRLKGWGKDPIASVICAVEFVGPCRFAGWAGDDYPFMGVTKGDPIAKGHPRAWVQIAAVSQKQTKNTMLLFPGLFTQACIDEHGIDIGKSVIYAYGGRRQIEAVTSSPTTLEGARSTFVIKNETHHWHENNDGWAMAETIERNTTKSKDGAARTLSITNAYEPSQSSVAQQERESWLDEVDAGWESTTMYDSLEAHPDALIKLPNVWTGWSDDGKKTFREPTEQEIRDYVAAVVATVRGDAVWLDVENIVDAIMKPKNSASQMRRFYYNQVIAAEDAWAHPDAIRAAIDPLAEDARRQDPGDALRAGWLVGPNEPIVLFFDGSKSRDATGLVGCRLSDGYVFTVGVWQRPRGDRGDTWLAPRAAVTSRVDEAHKRFRVVAFFADPSHALDDDDDTRYWDDTIDGWHRKYKSQYTLWAIKTGDYQHSIMWDMTSPTRSAQFVAAAERFIGELEHKNDIEEFEPQFKIDGHPALVRHMSNAKIYPHPKGYGDSLFKGARESDKKIDLAVCAVGARMLRRLVLNREEQEEERTGEVW
jgi:hypothetical protein